MAKRTSTAPRLRLEEVHDIEDDAPNLVKALQRNHPELFAATPTTAGTDQDRLEAALKAARAEDHEGVELSLDELSALCTPERFKAGEFVSSKMLATGCSPTERLIYLSEMTAMRASLVRELRAHSTVELMLVDVACAAYFHGQRLAAHAANLVTRGGADNFRAAELVDRAADRASRRAVGILELLRRGEVGAVSIDAVEDEPGEACGSGRRT